MLYNKINCMFRILKEKFGKLTKIKLVNTETKEYVSIIPECGVNLTEIVLKKNVNLFSILEGYKNHSELIKNEGFKGAKLMPFPNRINDGKYVFNKKNYVLPINFPSQKHAIHGLVYNKSFKIIKSTASKSSATLSLQYISNNLQGYPFKFELTVLYLLNSKGFECKTIVVNKDKLKIPIGDGWHPYFNLNDKVNDLFLKIPSNKKISVNKKMIPTGKKLKFNKFSKLMKIGKQVFDTGFVISKKKGVVKTEIMSKKLNLTVQIWQEVGKGKYNYLQVYIPPKRNSIAIEPMTCNTDAFNNKEGLIVLKPKEKFSASYGVNLK